MVKLVSALRFSNLFRARFLALAVMALVVLTGCVGKSPEPMYVTMQSVQYPSTADKTITDVEKEEQKIEKPEKEIVRLEPYKIEKSYKTDHYKKDLFSNTKKLSVAVDNMKLSEFITYIFSDIFNLDFVIDPSISKAELDKPVILNLQHDITENKLFSILGDLLAQHKIIVTDKDGIFFIQKDTGRNNIAFGMGISAGDIPNVPGKILQLVPVKYADAQNLLDFFPSGSSVKIRIARGENMFMLSGKRDDILTIVEIDSIKLL